jgi:hypothetical protein
VRRPLPASLTKTLVAASVAIVALATSSTQAVALSSPACGAVGGTLADPAATQRCLAERYKAPRAKADPAPAAAHPPSNAAPSNAAPSPGKGQ